MRNSGENATSEASAFGPGSSALDFSIHRDTECFCFDPAGKQAALLQGQVWVLLCCEERYRNKL